MLISKGARLDEDFYDSVRRGVENLLGPDDTYLEVFRGGT